MRTDQRKYSRLKKSIDERYPQKIYVSIARMSSNVEIPRINYGYSLQLTNWILDSSDIYHMKPEILYFIPGSFVETDKYIEVADGNFIKVKQTGKFQTEMCDDNENSFIDKSYNFLLAPDL